MDKIFIRDLRLKTIIGTFPHERKAKQEVLINITLECNLQNAMQSDELSDTVNYKQIKLDIKEIVENSQFFLIERLAGAIVDKVLLTKGVLRCTVTVDKPNALRFSRSVAVEITRSNR
ncbi:dihydroneopterin aldolase [Lentisphaerota bacterium WC36G]|nr:dihydroneopterin aldolase [Lentisphaerae bacterium WC36]